MLNMKLLLITLVAVVVGLMIACSSAPETPASPVPNPSDKELAAKFNRAIQYLKMNEYQKAVIEFTDVIGLVADTGFELSTRIDFRFDAHMGRGTAYSNLGAYPAAINDYKKALQYKSDSFSVYQNRGIAYKNWGQYDAAVQDFDVALRLNPDADTYMLRGHSYRKLDNHRKAINDYTKAIQLDPDNAIAYFYRGNSYYSLGELSYDKPDEHRKAINDYIKAIQLDPDNAAVYNNRAVVYGKLGRVQNADADKAKACLLDSQYC
jgi:tetratricopeptide (TPR) repeat protein